MDNKPLTWDSVDTSTPDSDALSPDWAEHVVNGKPAHLYEQESPVHQEGDEPQQNFSTLNEISDMLNQDRMDRCHEGTVEIECLPGQTFPAVIEPETWNGYAQPWFDAGVMDHLADEINEHLGQTYQVKHVRNGGWYVHSLDTGEQENLPERLIGGRIHYTLPGWCWTEVGSSEFITLRVPRRAVPLLAYILSDAQYREFDAPEEVFADFRKMADQLRDE